MKQNNITYRHAQLSDLQKLIEVGDDLFDFPIKEDRTLEFLNDPRHHLILAFDKENVVGMVSGVHYVHPDKDPTMFINEASVLDDYQNQGIGRKLIALLCEHAKAIGCKDAWVGTETSNIPAQKAYKAAGGKQEDESFVLLEFKF